MLASFDTGPSPRGDRCRTMRRCRSGPGVGRTEEGRRRFGVFRWKLTENVRRYEWRVRALGRLPAWATSR